MHASPEHDPNRLPISDLHDALINQSLHKSSDYFYGAEVALQDRLIAVGDQGSASSDEIDDIIKNWALRNLLKQELKISESDARLCEFAQGLLAQTNIDLETLSGGINKANSTEVMRHFVTDCIDWMNYLTTGWLAPRFNGRVPKKYRPGNIDELLKTAATTRYGLMLTLGYFDSPTQEERYKFSADKRALLDRLDETLSKFSYGLIANDKLGLAIAFGNLVGWQHEANWDDEFASHLAYELIALREREGDENYHQIYSYAMRTLTPIKSHLLRQILPKERRPLIFGSLIVRISSATEEMPYIIESFEDNEILRARLTTGEETLLPTINYRLRTLLNHGRPEERAIYETSTSVKFENLPIEAQEALYVAASVEENRLMRTETLPHYKRLALWPEGDSQHLYTVAFRDGYGRIISPVPDHHGLATSETERQLAWPVKSATRVRDGYIAVPYTEGYQTILDSHPNFFGPGETEANAFWIMGNSRAVYSEESPWLMRQTSYGQLPRFAIMPVRFMQVGEDREAPDPL